MKRKLYFVAFVILTLCTLQLQAQDIRIIDPSGDNPDEKVAIEDSRAITSIREFRKAIQRAEKVCGRDEDQCRQAVDNMVRYYHSIKNADPSFDLSKYEATYKKYAGKADEKQQQEHAAQDKETASVDDPVKGRIAIKVKGFPNMYYSALISQGKKDDYIFRNVRAINKDFIPNAVRFEINKFNSPVVTYYVYGNFTMPREIDERSLSNNVTTQITANLLSNTEHSGKPSYSFFDGNCILMGSDGTITIIHIPKKSDKSWDYNNTSVDVLAKDLETAKNVDLNARKNEAIDVMKMRTEKNR